MYHADGIGWSLLTAHLPESVPAPSFPHVCGQPASTAIPKQHQIMPCLCSNPCDPLSIQGWSPHGSHEVLPVLASASSPPSPPCFFWCSWLRSEKGPSKLVGHFPHPFGSVQNLLQSPSLAMSSKITHLQTTLSSPHATLPILQSYYRPVREHLCSLSSCIMLEVTMGRLQPTLGSLTGVGTHIYSIFWVISLFLTT